MNHGFSQMSTPPPSYGPPPGYGALPPGYGAPPPKNNTVNIVLIVLAVVFGGGVFVVAILAAILFPVFQKVRGNARLAVCETNVRQIELGLIQYTQDHNGKLPSSAAAYKDTVFPYIKNEAVFRCPSQEGEGAAYSMNPFLQGKSLDDLAHPEKIVLIYEGQNQTLDFRHDGKTVVGFADGHDKALTQAQIRYWIQTQDLRWKP